MKCPECQFDNLEDAKFCNACGTKLELTCTECGKVNPLGSRFCNECGKELRTAEEIPSIDFDQPRSYTPRFLVDKILTTRSSIEGERKVVTVLSADVAHFTSISEKLDPEEVHSIMDACFRILMAEIHQYEGTINQFLGDGIMAIFGAPVTHEDHALRACHAALAIQRALANYGEELHKEYGIYFRMRIGLNTGQVVVGSIGDDLRMDYTAMADTTNIACLLQQIAKPGQIVLSEKTYGIVKGYFHGDLLGEDKLKHRKEPVKYYELGHEVTKKSRVDLEDEEKRLTRFVNREEELAMVLDLFERVKKREGQVLCIVGEAGEGKSRLIHEFKKRSKLKNVRYWESQCISYAKSVPYYPIVEVLRKSFKISELDSQEGIRRNLKSKLTKLDKTLLETLPVLFRLLSIDSEEPSTKINPEQAKEMTFEALRLLLLSGSQVKPIIIVIENLQWIDTTSEEFISCIADSIASFPVFLILTYRVGYTHPFGSRSYLRQISLSHFSERDSKKIVHALLPNHRLPQDFIQSILDKAEGNPLYLEEIIKSLAERDVISKGKEGYRLNKDIKEIEIPETIQDIVLSRVDRLEEDPKRTLQAASVIGREFTLKLIARQEALERQLKRYIRELKHLELIQEKSLFPEIEYMFKNAVTKDVIYNSLLGSHRKELHRKIAEAIERLYGENEENYFEILAYHYLHSDAPDKSIYYLCKAGKKAKSVYANNEASEYFRKALELIDEHSVAGEPYKKEAHENLADLYDLVGDYPQAIHHYVEEMNLVSSSTEKTEILRKIGMIWEKEGDSSKAMKFYEEALDLIAEEEEGLEAGRIYMNIGWLYNRKGVYEKAMEFCNRALHIFQLEKSEYEMAQVLNNLAVIHEFYGQWDLAEKYNKESIALMEALGDQRNLGSFYISSGLLNWKRGKLNKSKKYFKKSLSLMDEIGNTLGMANSTLNLGRVYASEGNLAKALSHLERSLTMFQKMGTRAKLCQNYIALAEAYLKMGDPDTAKAYCDKGMTIALEVPYPFDQGKIYSILGQIDAKEDGKAEEHFAKSVEIFSSLGRKYELAVGMEQLGQAKIGKGRKKEGQKYVRDAKRIFQELGVEGRG